MHDSRHIPDLISSFKDRFEDLTLLDRIQLSLLEQDLNLSIALTLQFDFWLVTHLVDLLEKARFLDSFSLEVKSTHPNVMSPSEWYCANFAEYLFSSPDLWKTALGYLVHCPTVGKMTLESLIPRIPLGSKTKTQKLLLFCEKNELKAASQSIFRTLGLKALKGKKYSDAILHYLDANDLHRVAYIADELLALYINKGDTTFRTVVKGLSTTALFKSPRLAFMKRYHEYQEIYFQKSFQDAGDLAVQIFIREMRQRNFGNHYSSTCYLNLKVNFKFFPSSKFWN
jgi:hypothetical protein